MECHLLLYENIQNVASEFQKRFFHKAKSSSL